MIYNGEEWELVPWELLHMCHGKEVLLHGTYSYPGAQNDILVTCRETFLRSERTTLLYYDRRLSDGCDRCSIDRDAYANGGGYIPYLRNNTLHVDDSSCHCAGPSTNKWCFDTNKVETVCCRCRKRKRG